MSRTTCPYNDRPDRSFWKRVVAGVAPSEIDPVSPPAFTIQPGHRVATAGSCFAQHIARYLRSAGMAPFVTEPPPAPLDPETAAEFQYGTYSARYGNIYTTRQLLQLFDRAFNGLAPVDDAWEQDGRFFDPYRPSINPHGFHSRYELEVDREQHLNAVRRLFTELDVFVYTLGLTEAWQNRQDGMVYPVCPGCGWGEYNENAHQFVNFDVDQVSADLASFLERLRQVNRGAKVILTVSPVPLVATAENRHVLESTTLSKSVLRVAADIVQRTHDNVSYFPSYEIITGAFSRGAYYDTDLRSVLPEGVDHVMRTFFSAYVPTASAIKTTPKRSPPPPLRSSVDALAIANSAGIEDTDQLVDIICEEDQLDQPDSPA